MADNYLQFSEVISKITPAEESWLKDEYYKLHEVWANDAVDEPPGFELDFGLDKSTDREAWIHAEDGGDPDKVAAFVQRFIAKFRPDFIFTLTWSETCSAPRVGEFSGGGVVVTKDAVKWFAVVNLVAREVERIAAARGRSAQKRKATA